jgi:hypothetical protein
MNFQAGMQQPGILQPAEADSTSLTSIGRRRRFTEARPWARTRIIVDLVRYIY